MKYLRLLEWRNNARTVIYSVVHSVHIASRLFMCLGLLAGRNYRLSVLKFRSYSLIITPLWDMTHPVEVSGAAEETAVSIIRLDSVHGGGSSFLWFDCTRVLSDVTYHKKVNLKRKPAQN